MKLFHLQTSFCTRFCKPLRLSAKFARGERPTLRPLNALRPNHQKGKR
jgi:hypothetical protein